MRSRLRLTLALTLGLLAAAPSRAAIDDAQRARWNALLDRYVAWEANGGWVPVPWRGGGRFHDGLVSDSLSPLEAKIRALARERPLDARRQLAVGMTLLQCGALPEAVAPLRAAAQDPTISGQAPFLLGRTLVLLGRHREAIAPLQATPPGASCESSILPGFMAPPRIWLAAACIGAGDRARARRVLAQALGSAASLLDPSAPSAVAGSDEEKQATCLAGDILDLDGDRAVALILWRRGQCESRLDEVAAAVDPFPVLARRWSANTFGGPDLAFAVAAARLGDVEDATATMDARRCTEPSLWTPDCFRVELVRSRIGPLLGPSSHPASGARGALPSSFPFVERDVSHGLHSPYDPDRDDGWWNDDVVPDALADWWVVRLEREGDRIVAISRGRAAGWSEPSDDGLDPYRLHVSNDGGVRFDPPLYLGLAAELPYVIASRSRIPLIAEGNLQVEAMRARAIRGDYAGWPPEGEPLAVVLTAKLSDLARDSDGDGLTDTQERAWRLDSRRADTDGDTVPDAQDPVPRLPPTCARPALDSFLEWLVSDEAPAAIAGGTQESHEARLLRVRNLPGAAAGAQGPPIRQESLLLFTVAHVPLFARGMAGEPAPRAEHAAGIRILALSEDEVDLPPYSFAPRFVRARIVLDLDGSRAMVDLTFAGSGESWLVERGPAGWMLTGLSFWVE